MPPSLPSQQGSRAGLITTLVILAILFVTATALYIVQISETKKAEQDRSSFAKTYEEVLPDQGSASSDFVTKLKTAAETEKQAKFPGTEGRTSAEVIVLTRDELAKKITGDSNVSAANALNQAAAAIASAAGKVDGAPLTDNLVGAISKLAILAADAKSAKATAETAKADADKAKQAGLDSVAGELKKKDEQIEALKKSVSDEIEKTKSTREANNKLIPDIEAKNLKEKEALQGTINDQSVKIAVETTKTKALEAERNALRQKLTSFKLDPKAPISGQVDATITQLSANGTVYIDIGQGEQVSPGLTFEVYANVDGVPKLGNSVGDETLPIGKASIEVLRVGASSSECRITRKSPGTLGLAVGDLCMNIVYDRNTKLKFYVHGKFDLDQNDVATEQDAQVVKRLIAQWGGQVVDKIDIHTDFVVMGVDPEPKVPVLTDEEKNNAVAVANQQRAQEELKKYQEAVEEAINQHIPLMNQNRFLYFVGFYGQAKK